MINQEKIHIVIADDHSMVRKGLVALLTEFEDFQISGEAQDGEAAVKICDEQCPDVVLMDMVMPRMDGITASASIRQSCPDTQIIMLTSFADEKQIHSALKAGAISYLLKDVSGNRLADAIRRAHAGEPTLSPDVAQALIKISTRPPEPGHDLTEREREVLGLMMKGLNNRDISAQLDISHSTVKNHVSSVLGKLGAISRAQAVAIAFEHRILE